jgi:hypothetical protein
MKRSRNCPETCIVFVSFKRHEIAARSFESLTRAIAPYRDRVRIILSDATDDAAKIDWARSVDADDVILTPKFTPAATSRNLAMTLIGDKYSSRYVCMVEDDFAYRPAWYPTLVETSERLFGVISPWGLPYGMFCACDEDIPKHRLKRDRANRVQAYLFGAVAYQRFTLTSHYLSVMRGWDPDVLGISYAQTGGQTFRNTMRGFCGAIVPGKLSQPIEDANTVSTWRAGRRDPGPPAHSFQLEHYNVVREATRKVGTYRHAG